MREMIEAGIMKYGDAFKHSMENGGWDLSKVNMDELAESKATFVFGQMNEPPGARARVALSGLTIAEYYRDGDGQGRGRDILFFVDNIFRFTQAGSEVSALLGRMPSAVGYQPTLATEMGIMLPFRGATNKALPKHSISLTHGSRSKRGYRETSLSGYGFCRGRQNWHGARSGWKYKI